MTISISETIDYIHPAASGIGVIVTDQVWVIFDREIDETTVEKSLFVTGPDFDTWSGPDLQLFLDRQSTGTEDTTLNSPGFHGVVKGDFSFERISLTTLDEVETLDTIGSGHLFRTKAILTPDNQLQANTEYTVYLSGDDNQTDELYTGISSRTVFDPVTSGSNTGTGSLNVDGGYIGTADTDTYRIQITTAGDIGTSRFKFSRDSDPLTLYGPFKTKQSDILLSDGVSVSFDEGTYAVGDQWSFVVKERIVFSGNLYWPFKTGSGSIQEIPETTATSIIGDPASVATTSTSLTVSSTYPEDEASHITLTAGDFETRVVFDQALDATSVVSGVSVSVYAESVTGETDITASGELLYSPSIVDNTLYITIASGLLFQNNLVTITLDKDIAGIDGATLGSDYQFWFTTQYSPMYCTSRLVKLKIGSFITDLKTDTINLAIFTASREAGPLTWNKDYLDDEYYKFARSQWVCCKAAQILLINATGESSILKSKRLGDLEVEYNGKAYIERPLKLIEDCLAKWEGALMAGGRQVQTPKMVVKGDLDVDRPAIGRGWVSSHVPAANKKTRAQGSRRFTRGWWNR